MKHPTLVGYRGFSLSRLALSDLTALALNAIRDSAQSLSVNELHGAVVGIAVCNDRSFALQSLTDLLGVDALSTEENVELFVNSSTELLFSDDMSFTPLLADDDAPLEVRATALGEWTGSFVAGFVAGLEDRADCSFESLPEEVKEIIEDFVAIAEIDRSADSVEVADDPEEDLMQLQEFVKVCALLVMSLLNDVPENTTE